MIRLPSTWGVWARSAIAIADPMLSYGLFGAIWVQITLSMGDPAVWGISHSYGWFATNSLVMMFAQLFLCCCFFAAVIVAMATWETGADWPSGV